MTPSLRHANRALFFTLCLVALLPLWTSAQEPLALSHEELLSRSAVPLFRTSPVDVTAATRQLEAKVSDQPQPLEYATPFEVDITPAGAGHWEFVDLGRQGHFWVWRLAIESPGAFSVNLGFTLFRLPQGARLSVYAPDYLPGGSRSRIRQFSSDHNNPSDQMWVPLILGSKVIVELTVPELKRDQVKLRLGFINGGFRDFDPEIVVESGSCNVDVACSQGDPFRDQIRAVGVMSLNGRSLCSGSLINNTGAKRPIFITANHCGLRAGNAVTLNVFWNFQNSTCRPVGSGASGSGGDGSLSQFSVGSTFLATFDTSDFTLAALSTGPAPEFNVFLAGWDRSPGPFLDGAAGIHHPGVDEKRISLSNVPTEDDGGHHHRVRWRPGGIGVTEPGSSGSPVYTKQGRFIGQLTGGPSACGNADSQMFDAYGKLARSWDGGGTATTRARDHLDPSGTNAMMIDGRNWNDDVPPPTTIFSDGFNTDLGWTVNAAGSDTAVTGRWQRGNPEPTTSGGVAIQLGDCAGRTANCLTTGLAAGASAGTNDVDGGVTSIQSPAIILPSASALTLTFNSYFAHTANSSADDFFRVKVLSSGGVPTTVFTEVGTAATAAARWALRTIDLSSFAGQTVRLRFEAADNAGGSLVEAGVDDVKVTRR